MFSSAPGNPRIAEVRRLRGRRELTLDDGRVFSFSDEACERSHVRQGVEATPELLQQLDADDRRSSLHETALHLLSYRPRSEDELRRRLAMRCDDAAAIEAELERLRGAGLVDDDRFATLWVEERQRHAPRSARLLRHELRTKGVNTESAEAATNDVDDSEAALTFALARARKAGAGDFEKFAARTGSALQRRGFSYSTAASAVSAAWNATWEGSDQGR